MATNAENNPRHPVTGKYTKNPATGKGHIPLTSADHAASIPGKLPVSIAGTAKAN